jgi:hypothetical protein
VPSKVHETRGLTMTQFRFALSVKCPKCRARVGHWCRENGKCIPPHRERGQAAVRDSCAIFEPASFNAAPLREQVRYLDGAKRAERVLEAFAFISAKGRRPLNGQ